MKKNPAALLAMAVFSMVPVLGALASSVSLSASIDPSVLSVGDQATIVVTVKGKFRKSGKPELPRLDDFTVFEAGSSQNFSIINGSVSSSLSYTYILVPKKEGTYKIWPIRFRVGGKEYTADPVTIEVVKSQTKVEEPPLGEGREGRGLDSRGRHIFIRASVDKDTAYVNEQITWTLGFYMDRWVNLMQSPNYSPPSAEGFWVEDLPPQKKYYKTIKDRRYLVNEIKRAYFPTSPGDYLIGPAQVEVVIDDFDMSSWDDFFSRPFKSFGFGKPVNLSTEEKKIVVLPLPSSRRPRDFSGIVGRDISLSLHADKQVAQLGEPINIAVEVRGEGNIKTISPPRLPELSGFKIYESGVSSDVFKKNYIVSGRKRYEYVLVPKVPGKKRIPPLEISYFDPVGGEYRKVSSTPVILDVKPGPREEGRKIVFAGGGSEIEILGRDIKYIHPVPAVIRPRGGIFFNKTYVALHVLPLFAVFFSLVVEKRRKKWRENKELARAGRAARAAEKRFAEASRLLKRGRVEEAFSAVSAALTNYFADKMNVSASGLTVQKIEDFLGSRSVEGSQIAEVRSVLQSCDAVRYAPSVTSDTIAREVLERATLIVRTCEKKYLG